MLNRHARSTALACCTVFLAACGSGSSTPQSPSLTSASVSTPAPTPTPTPAPTPTPGPGNIAYIRVGFYGVECFNGQTAPNNGARRLPVGCFGYVTATPKQSNGQDVDAAEHGPDIAWEVVQGEAQIKVMEVPQQKFNKVIRGRTPGAFSLCATVRTVTGCLDGQVVP